MPIRLGDWEYGFNVLTPAEVDIGRGSHRNLLHFELGRRLSGMIMKPTVFVKYVTFWYRMISSPDWPGPVAEAEATWEFSSEMYDVYHTWKTYYGPDQAKTLLTDNSRLAFGCGALSINEIEHKLKKKTAIEAALPMLDDFKTEREEIRHVLIDAGVQAARHASIGEHTQRYIKEHENSSVKPGVKWGSIADDKDALTRILDAVQARWEFASEHRDDLCRIGSPGGYALIDPESLGIGNRARGPSIDPLAGRWRGLIPRGRLVLFTPGASGLFAFIDAKSVYCDSYHKVASILGLSDISVCPVAEGGAVWERIYTASKQGHFVAHDGSTWELNVPAILLMAYPIATDIGADCLLSGLDFTSITGGAANMVWTRAEMEQYPSFRPKILAFQGDDRASVVSDLKTLPPDVPGVYELDVEATKHRRYLGLVMQTEENWHPHGFKATLDKPEAAIRIQPLQKWRGAPEDDDEHSRAVVSVYKGVLMDGTPIREALQRVDFRDSYLSPEKVREALEGATHYGSEGSDYELELERAGHIIAPQ